MAGQVTPTGSFNDSILTPPSSDRKSTQHICSILHAFQYHYNGGKPRPWVSYRLGPEEYADLLRKVESKPNLSKRVVPTVNFKRLDRDACNIVSCHTHEFSLSLPVIAWRHYRSAEGRRVL
jgi:hypothetical protein